MPTVPLSQPYIPKTMGHMVWVCGTAVAWSGTHNKLTLKKKDLASILGTALGTVGPLFGAFQVSQPLKNSKPLGQPAILTEAGSERMCNKGKKGSDFRTDYAVKACEPVPQRPVDLCGGHVGGVGRFSMHGRRRRFM
jgi:hypothetical protein